MRRSVNASSGWRRRVVGTFVGDAVGAVTANAYSDSQASIRPVGDPSEYARAGTIPCTLDDDRIEVVDVGPHDVPTLVELDLLHLRPQLLGLVGRGRRVCLLHELGKRCTVVVGLVVGSVLAERLAVPLRNARKRPERRRQRVLQVLQRRVEVRVGRDRLDVDLDARTRCLLGEQGGCLRDSRGDGRGDMVTVRSL